MRKPVSSCLCGCHYQGVGYCERCSRVHKYEWDSKEIVQDNHKEKNFRRFKKKRRRL